MLSTNSCHACAALRRVLFTVYCSLFAVLAVGGQETFVFSGEDVTGFPLVTNGQPAPVVTDEKDDRGVLRAAADLRDDFRKVTGNSAASTPARFCVIVGTAGKSALIDKLIAEGKIDGNEISGKYEKYLLQTVARPMEGVEAALVIAGSDRRGAIYGIYELSAQIGVSPWYYWADVPVERQTDLYVKPGIYTDGEPAVAYRGIFLNDEAPALSGWAEETFGGFNSRFYAQVFELILRLKGNFLWPAMWGRAFYDDDPKNGALADEYGIVIGTSHHEPMGRAHDEWRRYGKGAWNYDKNPENLQNFWREGMERIKDWESWVTVGMRGDGDEPMSEASNVALLQRIVNDQRTILSEVTDKPADEVPQVWALYKEVQDYYDKGMRVPDDITLMLCDDNWGNVRKLPDINAPKRKGGYGMYYHLDYVGGPRNYKWINVSQVQRIWEQMNLTYAHGVKQIWIVNVGDLKPMEYPISFFLDMAWNPHAFHANNLLQHTEEWCARQFGLPASREAARLINLYTKYNHRITPELLNDTIYSLDNYNEFEQVVQDYRDLLIDAMRLYYYLPAPYRDAFDQLVLYPIHASANLYEMYFAIAQNKRFTASRDDKANYWADKAKECYARDSLLSHHYNKVMAGGKWNHIMDQVHIGYTYWQQPERNTMPSVSHLPKAKITTKCFIESNGYVSIEAGNYARSQGTSAIRWEVIPDLGKTQSGVTTFPPNAYPSDKDSVWLEYDIRFASNGEFPVHILVSPTLNFNENRGLRYALSIDGGKEKIVNINQTYTHREMEHWQADRINSTQTTLTIPSGRHTLRFRVLEPGIVLQKIMIDTGGLRPSFLGAPESEITTD